MIEIKNLSKIYKQKNKNIQVIENISLDIKKNEIISIIGPSGCGKTTLLKLISGLIRSSEGKIKINKKDVEEGDGNLSLIFQKPVLLSWRTVRENIELPLELLNKEDRKSVEELIRIVGLEGFEESYPNELSGGMKQRVALGRALVIHPELLLMDEPFGSLDDLSRNKLNAELLKIWEEIPTTILLVTHSISEAVFLSDKVIILSERPSRVKDIVNIDLDRPRDLSIKEENKFQEYVRCIRSKIE